MKNFKKIVCLAVMMALMFNTVTTANASEVSSETMTVSVSVESDYVITIPKNVTISKEDPTYEVRVSGSLEEGKTLTIQPSEYVVFESASGGTFEAAVRQDKCTWVSDDLKETGVSTAQGHIDIAQMGSGEWSASLTFNINYFDN